VDIGAGWGLEFIFRKRIYADSGSLPSIISLSFSTSKKGRVNTAGTSPKECFPNSNDGFKLDLFTLPSSVFCDRILGEYVHVQSPDADMDLMTTALGLHDRILVSAAVVPCAVR